MQTLRNLTPLIDAHLIVVVVLSLCATFVCQELNVTADLPADVISIAVIFPVVFTIAEAHSRREQALSCFASLKANAVALTLAARDWPEGPGEFGAEGAAVAKKLFAAIHHYFKADKAREHEHLLAVYQAVADFSLLTRRILAAGVSPSELSRASQFLNETAINFERMRNFHRYRTPIALRAFSRVFLTGFPILFAPYFAYFADQNSAWLGYAVAMVYTTVLVSLDNIQEQLEDPYDGVGPDDLHLDAVGEYDAILGGNLTTANPA